MSAQGSETVRLDAECVRLLAGYFDGRAAELVAECGRLWLMASSPPLTPERLTYSPAEALYTLVSMRDDACRELTEEVIARWSRRQDPKSKLVTFMSALPCHHDGGWSVSPREWRAGRL